MTCNEELKAPLLDLGPTMYRACHARAEQQFRDEVRNLTSRKSHCVPQKEVLERVNHYVQGWVNYFHLQNSTRVFAQQRFFLEQLNLFSTLPPMLNAFRQSNDRGGILPTRRLAETKGNRIKDQ